MGLHHTHNGQGKGVGQLISSDYTQVYTWVWENVYSILNILNKNIDK